MGFFLVGRSYRPSDMGATTNRASSQRSLLEVNYRFSSIGVADEPFGVFFDLHPTHTYIYIRCMSGGKVYFITFVV